MAARVWADLPPELIQSISDRLGLINLLSFRGVCKSWNLASVTSSAEIESSPYSKPWYLLYGGETSQCRLLSGQGDTYKINIPELKGATCIASKDGWLLLYREGSMYFFCPFSRAKIDLPQFPCLKLTGHVAAFSSAPTSNDCTVAVACQNNEMEIELFLLSRGADAWTKQEHTHFSGKISKITTAAYADKTFQFFDDQHGLLAFSPEEDEKWVRYNIVPPSRERPPGMKSLAFCLERNSFIKQEVAKHLELEEDVSISSCGTLVPNGEGHTLYLNENISESQESGSQLSRGVWLMARFYQIPPGLRW